jgi:hypothetical protein
MISKLEVLKPLQRTNYGLGNRFWPSIWISWPGTSESPTSERSCIELILKNLDDLNSIERWNSLRLNHSRLSQHKFATC